MEILEEFKCNLFNPLEDDSKNIPNDKGLYILCAKDIHALPTIMHNLQYSYFQGYPVIYLGISESQGLKKRDYRTHFKGKARRSTLRKSLGVLFEYRKTQCEREFETKNYKFIEEHEQELSQWMMNNLLMYYYIANDNLKEIETNLIEYLNPPLNLSKNKNEINKEFRKQLSKLRNTL